MDLIDEQESSTSAGASDKHSSLSGNKEQHHSCGLCERTDTERARERLLYGSFKTWVKGSHHDGLCVRCRWRVQAANEMML